MCVPGREPPPCVAFLLHIDLFTHSADMMAQGPSSHLYSHSTHGTVMKRLADRFTGFTVNTSHPGQSILQTSILAYWTFSGNKKGSHEVALNPLEKAVLAGRPIWPMKTMIPTTRHIGEKAKERRERKENQIPISL